MQWFLEEKLDKFQLQQTEGKSLFSRCVSTHSDGEKDGEPAEHAWRVGCRIDTQHDFFVKDSFKVTGKSMQYTILPNFKLQSLESSVINWYI